MVIFFRLFLIVSLMGSLVCCSTNHAQQKVEASLRVRVADGWYEGAATEKTRAFLGIRYAQAPTGALRFASPMPMPMHDGVWGAKVASPPCPQLGVDGKPVSTDEDCLTVNVITPRNQTAGQALPVMVWFHGGGFTVGDGHQYDPARLVEEGNVIVVTANFRLGVLAQLGLPGVPGSGDFGLADQLSVLQWAHRNVSAFGGDPQNVTMFGESSGAMSICALLSSPSANGLAAKAILSSGSCATSWPAGTLALDARPARPYAPVAESERHGLVLAKEVGCSQAQPVDCLRRLPAEVLLSHAAEFGNLLAYGTPLLPEDPLQAVMAGTSSAIPVISGSNHDEGTAAVAGSSRDGPIDGARYEELVRNAFGAQNGRVLEEYPLAQFPSPGDAWARIATDAAWICPAMRADAALARSAPVYSYEFDDLTAPNMVDAGASGVALGAAHATELSYLFDVSTLGGVRLGPKREDLAKRMIRYWTSFAWRSEPKGDVPWPRRGEGANGPVLRIYPAGQKTPSPLTPWDEHKCSFWGSLGS